MTDENIVKLYFDRNEKAISVTKTKYGKYLYTIAHNILHTKEDSEESVNETYLAAWNTIPPEKPNILKTYLAKITRNISLKCHRKSTAQKRGGAQTDIALDELGEIFSSDDSVEETLERDELLKATHNLIRTLDTEQRRIFLARYWYLYSIKDISRKLGYSESKVKVTLKRTRDKLKETLLKEGLL